MENETTTRTWTVLSLMNWTEVYLASNSIDGPRLTAELLLAHVLQCSRMDIYLNFDKPLTKEELARFKELLRRRVAREPLQYILGDAVFMGLTFKVDRRVLIPRPETEILVERTIDTLRSFGDRALRVLDIGTGSGNIAVSIAHFLKNARVVAVDVSEDALDVAEANARSHKVDDRVEFRRINILASVEGLSGFDCVVSNPPYVTHDEANTLSPEIIKHEPRIAVFGREEGLEFFRRIAEIGMQLLNPVGVILVETAYDQAAAVKTIFTNCGYREIEVFKDYDGNDRVVHVKKEV
jgi:release factor glutamine methyltransferase